MGIDQEMAECVVIARTKYLFAGASLTIDNLAVAADPVENASAYQFSVRVDLMPVKEGAQIMIAYLEEVDAFMIFRRGLVSQCLDALPDRPLKGRCGGNMAG